MNWVRTEIFLWKEALKRSLIVAGVYLVHNQQLPITLKGAVVSLGKLIW